MLFLTKPQVNRLTYQNDLSLDFEAQILKKHTCTFNKFETSEYAALEPWLCTKYKKNQQETQKYDGFYNSENLTHHVTVIIQHL